MAGGYQDSASSRLIPSEKSRMREWVKTHKAKTCLIFRLCGYSSGSSRLHSDLRDRKQKKWLIFKALMEAGDKRQR